MTPVKALNKTIGILCNPMSGRVRKNTELIRQQATGIPNSLYREATTFERFRAVLDEFAGAEVGVLLIIAGDGTFHAVLTDLFNRRLFAEQPLLALVPGGTTNMSAYDFGIRDKPIKSLQRFRAILAKPETIEVHSRAVLKVTRQGNEPLYGMFFGVGLIVEGVKFFKAKVQSLGITGERASALVAGRYLLSLLCNATSYGEKFGIRFNNETKMTEDYLLILASTLDRLLVGSRPYWGKEASLMHVTSVRQAPERLRSSLLPILIGKGAILSGNNSYRSNNLNTLEIEMESEFIIDGEIYPGKGRLQLSTPTSIQVMAF